MILNKSAHRLSTENNAIPMRPAVSHERSRFLFRSFGVQIARKSEIIHTIERMNMMTPKLPLMSFFRSVAISLRSIQNIVLKNPTWSGLKTMYARKLPKNITATKKRLPANFIKSQNEIGSRGFLGRGAAGVVSPTDVVSDGTTGASSDFFIWMISSRSEAFAPSFLVSGSSDSGVSDIEKN